MCTFETCFKSFLVVVAVLVGTFGVVEVVYGGIYFNSHTCDGSSVVSPTLWLVISGSTRFLSAFLLLFDACCKNCLSDLILVFVFLFDIGWSIIGGVVLWHDCEGLQPDNLRVFMWIAVITTCASILQVLTIPKRPKTIFGESYA